jgi:PKD repeat protein
MESCLDIAARATAMLQAVIRASRIATIAGVAAVLAACGGGGGGTNSIPVASFTATPTSGKAPLQVSFDASASRDPDGTIASYQWNFDGTATGSGVTAQHTYAAGGTFTARLTVTDNAGATASVTRTITVQPPTGELEVTVKEEFNTAVPGALVSATVGSVTRSGNTNASGVIVLTDLPTGSASVRVSRQGFAEQTVAATINTNQRTAVSVTLGRIKDAAGGVLTTQVIGSPADNGRTLTIEVQLVVVDESSNAITGLNNTAFRLPDCTPAVPDPDTFASECIRFPDAKIDGSYTVDNVGVPEPADVVSVGPKPEADFAVSLLMDQSGSIRSTDPTGARLISAKAFVQSVTPASGDSVLLAAFADDNNTQQALISPKPLKTYDPFVQDGASYFDDLDGLRELTAGGTPLYRVLYPEATDVKADPAFTSGLIAKVNATAPAGKAKAIAIFTDGDDTECGGPNVCREKRQRVVAAANASGISLFTIGLSTQVNFEALGELARDANGVFLFAENAEQLIPLYGSLGRLLSGSLATYKIRWTIRAPADGTFVSGNSALGQVQVTAGGSTFAVPFIVGIP